MSNKGDDLFSQAKSIYTSAVNEYKPRKTFCLFSGGHDSLSITHWAMEEMGADAVAHVNTGIGIEETRDFVRETCNKYGWPLHEYHAGKAYEDIIKEHGFPGPQSHRFMYILLKERGVADLVRDHKEHRNDNIMLVTGVRKQESNRRMGTIEPVYKQGARIWTAPFVDMSKIDVNRYLQSVGAPRNQVVDTLHMSGECLCGAFAHKGEFDEIKMWYPHVAAEIERLEKVAEEHGKPWRWEHPGPPDWYKQMQQGQQIFGFDNDPQMMCTSCNARNQLGESYEVDRRHE